MSSVECFAATAPGISAITAGELQALGITPAERLADGVAFSGDSETLARANHGLRTASRVLVRMGAFSGRTFAELERHAKKLDWRAFAEPGGEARFRVTARKCRLYHTGAVAERLAKVAGLTLGSEAEGISPDAQLFVVRGVRDEWVISADSSGEHLHRRGYRLAMAKAPLRETLAAAAVLATDWDRASPLVDPFCGSGTICIEGALIATGSPPGGSRQFAFTRWPSVIGRRAPLPSAPVSPAVSAPVAGCRAYGYDRDAGAAEAARSNARRAGVEAFTEFAQQPLSALIPPGESGCLVTNPPYGVRVGERGPLRDLYARFGAVVRERCEGWSVSFFSADPVLERATRLSLEPVFTTENGGLRVRFVTTGVL